MADETQAAKASSQAATAAGSASSRRVYEAGRGRKILFTFAFLLLLPFFASLPAMLYHRAIAHLWDDAIGLLVFAAGFTVIMLLVVFELVYSLRARIELGETALRFSLPAARGGAMPKLFYRTREIPYSDIAEIETRREIYGGSVAPVLLHGARLITRTGDKIPLGYVSEADTDPLLPFPEIAEELGKRTGAKVVHRGNVRREMRKKLFGIRAVDQADSSIPDSAMTALNQRHNRVVLMICSALFLLVAAGLVQDLVKMDLDSGERGDAQTQKSAKASPQAQRVKSGH